MCGGKVTTVTCSRVGHVFKQSPNKFDGTEGTKEHTVQRNLMRVADVWMDNSRKVRDHGCYVIIPLMQ